MSDGSNGAQNGGTKATPPYASFVSFKRFLGDLAEKGLPHRIDKTVMKGRSGADQSTLKGALEFLGLIDDHGTPTDALRALRDTASEPEKWKATLGQIVTLTYNPIVGDLALKTGTSQQLADRFRENGHVRGVTLTRAVRFYLAALDEAGIERSQYFAAPPRPKPSIKKNKGDEGGKGDGGGESGDSGQGGIRPDPNEGLILQTFAIPGRKVPIQVSFPMDLKPGEWEMVAGFMQQFINLRAADDDE